MKEKEDTCTRGHKVLRDRGHVLEVCKRKRTKVLLEGTRCVRERGHTV